MKAGPDKDTRVQRTDRHDRAGDRTAPGLHSGQIVTEQG